MESIKLAKKNVKSDVNTANANTGVMIATTNMTTSTTAGTKTIIAHNNAFPVFLLRLY